MNYMTEWKTEGFPVDDYPIPLSVASKMSGVSSTLLKLWIRSGRLKTIETPNRHIGGAWVTGRDLRTAVDEALSFHREAKKRRGVCGVIYRASQNKARQRYRDRWPNVEVAHKIIVKAIKSGVVMILPCEICGAEKTQAHHDDYSKPLVVRWLCREHHLAWHKKNTPLNRK